jgi:hypothetical protein
VFLPHSTHTFQPLDVVCPKPLSNCYTKELTRHLHKTQGLIPVKKGDFFPLFWRAWVSSFTARTVLKSFEATGLWPMNREAVLKRFKPGLPQEQGGEAAASALEPSNLRQMDRLVRSVIRSTAAEESKLLSQTLHQLQVQNELLRHENEDLREAVTLKQKQKQPSKALDMRRKESYHGGATFWSPRKMREARAREVEKQQQEEAEIAVKANRRELQATAKLLKEQ